MQLMDVTERQEEKVGHLLYEQLHRDLERNR